MNYRRRTTTTRLVRALISALGFLTVLGPASVADAQTVAVLFNGFSARLGGSGSTGMDELEERLTAAFGDNGGRPFSARVFEHDEEQEALAFINGLGRHSCLILIGHSWGGATAIQLASAPTDAVGSVALLVQLDSVGLSDDQLPDRVDRGVNYFQRSTLRESGDVTDLPGEDFVTGSDNYRVEAMYGVSDDKVTHTTIDDARFAFRPREYRAIFGGQRDLHARIEELVEDACLQ